MTPKWALIHAAGRVAFAAIICGSIAGAGAQQFPQVNRSHSFGPDQCGPADPSYIKTANETGGVPLFLQRSEAGKAMQLMVESTRENVSTVLWASMKLAGVGQKFEIPVDSVTERITFTFSVDTKGTKLVLREPNGQEVGPGSPSVEYTNLNCGRVITVIRPQAGVWHAEVSGTGTYWLQAQAQSDIYFIKAEFVQVGGRPGHEGLFRIQGQPISGEPATLQVSMSATAVKTTVILLVNTSGDVLQKLKMKTTDHDREFLELTGELKALPNIPFRIAVTGRDKEAMTYQRFYSSLFHTEAVQVTPKPLFDEIAPGARREEVFTVRNLGQSRTFKVTVTDSMRFVTKVEPRELTVGSHGTGIVRVELVAPAGTQKSTEDDLVVVVSSASGAPTTNSAILHLSVTDNSNR
jgi:von Willebrand factor A domain-containing protein 7